MNHGEYLRMIIDEKGITQQAFADMLINSKTGKVGVSRQFAIKLLDMERLPHQRIEEINRILDIDIVKGSSEVVSVNEHQASSIMQLHRIEMLKKDIEALRDKLLLRDKMIENLEESVKYHKDNFEKVMNMIQKLTDQHDSPTPKPPAPKSFHK